MAVPGTPKVLPVPLFVSLSTKVMERGLEAAVLLISMIPVMFLPCCVSNRLPAHTGRRQSLVILELVPVYRPVIVAVRPRRCSAAPAHPFRSTTYPRVITAVDGSGERRFSHQCVPVIHTASCTSIEGLLLIVQFRKLFSVSPDSVFHCAGSTLRGSHQRRIVTVARDFLPVGPDGFWLPNHLICH